ncbi:hypothetical protein QMK17_21290 [Rhodococcus sp. G-MC3]|uniref:hypothetical protein n=1 Tax=Rhodococcus sp. G-MC3 TaxID=3046209 RepID=UPI0024B8CA2D|nr:hypothetical protein [Rhodococcus sp. G-MC3]MDJ0395856.1 hypothetical protein [Rhodococcus sp. G-MC3]
MIESTHDRVHGVWVCTFPSTESPTTPAPSWSFLWDLEAGFAMRSEATGMSSSWIDLGVPTRRPIADALQAFDLSDQNATALAGLVRRSGTSVDRYTVVEHRPGIDRHVHFAVHSHLGSAPETSPRFLRGLSVDIGAAPPSIRQPAPQFGDRIAQALTTGNQYRAISDPDTLNLLHWHGTPAPRIAWMADNTADAPILHPDDMPAAKQAVEDLRASDPGRRIDLTVRFLTLDGDYEPIELTISLIELEAARAALLVVLTVT